VLPFLIFPCLRSILQNRQSALLQAQIGAILGLLGVGFDILRPDEFGEFFTEAV
jgi:hypothetical protein